MRRKARSESLPIEYKYRFKRRNIMWEGSGIETFERSTREIYMRVIVIMIMTKIKIMIVNDTQ